MHLNYIASSNNSRAGFRILNTTLAFLVIWHLKNPSVIVNLFLTFWHMTFLVDTERFSINMKFTFVLPFESCLWLRLLVRWCQMGLLQAQAQLLQLQLMPQRVHDTDIQQSALPDWAVSEPQNRVDNRRRSRSRPPLTDDHRRTGRVEGPARRPGRIEGSSMFVSSTNFWTVWTYDPIPWFILSLL